MPGKDTPKIIKPGQMEVPLEGKEIPFGGTLQIQINTPEGRVFVVIVQPADYSWEADKFLINVGQVDLTEAAKQGKIMGPQKGIIS